MSTHRNLEVKIRIPDDHRIRERMEEQGLEGVKYVGFLEQTDTYYRCTKHGKRLKWRTEVEGTRVQHWLVTYERPNYRGARYSSWARAEVLDCCAEDLKKVLEDTLGIRAVVMKRRNVWMWGDHTRVHLDDVRDLGEFLELELVKCGDKETGEVMDRAIIENILERLELHMEPRIAHSYGEMLVDSTIKGCTFRCHQCKQILDKGSYSIAGPDAPNFCSWECVAQHYPRSHPLCNNNQ